MQNGTMLEAEPIEFPEGLELTPVDQFRRRYTPAHVERIGRDLMQRGARVSEAVRAVGGGVLVAFSCRYGAVTGRYERARSGAYIVK